MKNCMTKTFYKDTHPRMFLTSMKLSIAVALLPSQRFPYWGDGGSLTVFSI